ncbi:MAG: hypothetical protein BGO51_01400 [Rhodospirillales bacterium 69-11]|mgnify:CR=1 FL=1|nr:hypothetical protein [Rhodospirillales bacterium]OJW25656.1 MAG: hypothetical protein BGO51_01400 [Rhodospirillales bacterium 69-11]
MAGLENLLDGAEQDGQESALVSFYRMIPSARLPLRADRSAAGSLPTRAFRYCEPVTAASAFGYYVFAPMNFSLLWDGTDVMWRWEGEPEWQPLTATLFPGFADQFDAAAPPAVQGWSPPFLAALQEPGLVQMWTGYVVRTRPGWSLLVRPPANLPRRSGFEPYEGIVETDRWFGPLSMNFRLTKTDTPIEIQTELPLLQVQPMPRFAYEDRTLNQYEMIPELGQLSAAEWESYHDTVVAPHLQPVRTRGQYAAAARKRRAGDQGRES